MGGAVTYESLQVELAEGIAVIIIQRPEQRNALNATVRRELAGQITALTEDAEARVIVITGAGDRAFVAGADIGEFAERSVDEQRAVMSRESIFQTVWNCPKPVIAMINGYALGGGCELALACDIRIAADTAKLGQPEVNLAIIPGGGGTQRLPRLVGYGQALRLILSGTLINATEAAAIGLVDLVVPAEELREQTLDLARGMAAKSPVALAAAKVAVRAAYELPLSGGLACERELFLACFASEDKREGVAAFLEKRPAEFSGR